MPQLVAVAFIPQTWKFLWAPVVDTTLQRKTWYVLSAVLTAAGIFFTGALPASAQSMPALYVVVLLANLAVTFLAMSVESLMVYCTRPTQLGRASGWFQAGNLGGQGLGGGAGLWMAQTLPEAWMGAAVLALACALCSGALLAAPRAAVAGAQRELHARSAQCARRPVASGAIASRVSLPF